MGDKASRTFWRSLTVGLWGALGGALNAWLCYAKLPVAVEGHPTFHWHVIPAGAVHGGVLAAMAFGSAAASRSKRVALRLAVAAPLAWVAGYASWIPLDRSVFAESWPKSWAWPFDQGWTVAIYGPFLHFGLVALTYYIFRCFWRDQNGLAAHLVAGISAGILGSLWWWIVWETWYFSILHGALWGLLVGVGAWKASEGRRPTTGPAAGANA